MLNKQKLGALALLALPSLLLFTSCDPNAIKGDGEILTETRTEKDFTGVDAAVPGKINVKHGPIFKVVVQVEENLLPYLKTEVESNGVLHIYFSEEVRDVDGLVVSLTMPALESIRLSGSGTVATTGLFSGASMDIDVSGSGEVVTDFMDFDNIDVQLSGSGEIELHGTGGILKSQISGSGDFEALDCPVREAEVSVSGSGTARVDVAQKLKARVSGSGDVYYEGDPVVDGDVSGSGKILKI